VRELAEHDVALVRADNPGPFTLEGTNTWLVGREPCWVVDPGPAREAHVDAVLAQAVERGGIGGIALTHDHADHSGAVADLRRRAGGPPVAAARFTGADVRLADGDAAGPLRAVATPGHAPDHLAFVAGRALFSGDAVLGHGSVFVWPDPGALRAYLAALERLATLDVAIICPGHGPLVLDPPAKLAEYLEHRRDRERRLVAALEEGRRGVEELLDSAWSDVPQALRRAAAVTLAAHLDKLEEEGRLPAGVQRPQVPGRGSRR
jgi:glyoxylase-like metal-dependent hydrolase (beta-lactamase superfamily II)